MTDVGWIYVGMMAFAGLWLVGWARWSLHETRWRRARLEEAEADLRRRREELRAERERREREKFEKLWRGL